MDGLKELKDFILVEHGETHGVLMPTLMWKYWRYRRKGGKAIVDITNFGNLWVASNATKDTFRYIYVGDDRKQMAKAVAEFLRGEDNGL